MMTGYEQMILAVCVVILFAIAGFTGYIAKVKGYSFPVWWVLGFMFGILAMIAIAVIPKKSV